MDVELIPNDVEPGLISPGWCETHQDFAWRYLDGSSNCFFVCMAESPSLSHECRTVPIAPLRKL